MAVKKTIDVKHIIDIVKNQSDLLKGNKHKKWNAYILFRFNILICVYSIDILT